MFHHKSTLCCINNNGTLLISFSLPCQSIWRKFSHLFGPQKSRINFQFLFFPFDPNAAHKENLTWPVLVFCCLIGEGAEEAGERERSTHSHKLATQFYAFLFSVSFLLSASALWLLPLSIFHFPLPLQLLLLRQCLHFITFRANKTCHLPSCPLPQVFLLFSLPSLHTLLPTHSQSCCLLRN